MTLCCSRPDPSPMTNKEIPSGYYRESDRGKVEEQKQRSELKNLWIPEPLPTLPRLARSSSTSASVCNAYDSLAASIDSSADSYVEPVGRTFRTAAPPVEDC